MIDAEVTAKSNQSPAVESVTHLHQWRGRDDLIQHSVGGGWRKNDFQVWTQLEHSSVAANAPTVPKSVQSEKGQDVIIGKNEIHQRR